MAGLDFQHGPVRENLQRAAHSARDLRVTEPIPSILTGVDMKRSPWVTPKRLRRKAKLCPRDYESRANLPFYFS